MASKTRRYGLALIYAALLTAFTAYVLLDAFVIPRTYRVIESVKESVKESAPDAPQAEPGSAAQPEISASSYKDANIEIHISAYREYDTDIYVADITLNSADYLKTAFANGAYGKNITQKTTEAARNLGALLAINGDYYGSRNAGYVIREGAVYREKSAGDSQQDLVIYADGGFSIVSEREYTARDLLAAGARQVFSFGPGLVANGEICVPQNYEVDRAMTSNPRTALGILGENHYAFVVSDGRTDLSDGLTVYQLAEFMRTLGAEQAYNLDGGGSSTMVFMGEIVNHPTTSGRNISERAVSDFVYIGY